VVCTHRQGNVSYLVSTVPAGWAWSSEKQLTDSYRKSIEGAAQAYNVGGQGKLQNERDAHVYAVRHTSSSHHALVVDVSAVGEGMFRGASEIQLTVIAELVYVGTNRPQLGFSAPDRPNQTP
jgi:hypothetical protein